MEKRNKEIIGALIGGIVVISAQSIPTQVLAADAICAGAAGNGTSVVGTATNFIKATFTPRCSNNVHLDYGVDASQSTVFVKSFSAKGKTYYGGNTTGGTVTSCSTFTSAPTSVTAGTSDGCA